MIARILAVTAVALAGFLPAAESFQAKEGTVGWAESWEAALEEASFRNVPIFVTIQQDNNPACTAMEAAFRDAAFIKGIQRCVPLVGNGETAHGTRDVKEGGTKVSYCKLYEGIKCEHHVNCNSAAGLFFRGEFGVPSQVWVKFDPKAEGRFKEMFKNTGPQGTGAQGAAEILKDMERALGNIAGKSMNRKEYMDMKRLLNEGTAFFEKNEWKKAIDSFKKVKESKSERFAAKGEEQLKNLENAGMVLVEQALEIAQTKPKDGKAMMTKITKEFDPEWECTKKAKELLAKMK